ncbi:MAG: NnrS family protein [Proteobacteria bacterium]|nr:NnrS family protein [Pseudomonadota bacterium]
MSIDPFRPAFRLFFFAGSFYAVVAIFLWLLPMQEVLRYSRSDHSISWHIHEMLYGFVAAIITGYLLTTVSRAGSNKYFVCFLLLAWFSGRLVMNCFYYSWPAFALFTLDSLFPLIIASLVIKDLIIGAKKEYLLLIPILFLFPAVNILFHFGKTENIKVSALLFLNHMIILMITIIGGRLIYSLTLSWQRSVKSQYLPESKRTIEMGVIVVTVITAFIDVFFPGSVWLYLSALIASLFHFLRMWGWRTFKVLSSFSLLIVHLAYAWIVVGYFILAFSYYVDWINHSSAMHVLNIGTIATMILVVMTRLSIRTKNNFIKITSNITFILIFFATILRLSASLLVESYKVLLLLSGALWMMAFVTFLISYSLSIYDISVFKKNRTN